MKQFILNIVLTNVRAKVCGKATIVKGSHKRYKKAGDKLPPEW